MKTALHKKKGGGRDEEGKKGKGTGKGKVNGKEKGEGRGRGRGRGRKERVDQNRCGNYKKATHKKGSRLAWAGRHHLRCNTAIIRPTVA